ncbi:flagellar basal body L-ring protein FlgH [Fontivita pretiosa]|uniref:flagellar basal body L-ring protein FlgH n=1 Tax=Fontivita pretiosa TaxID=2989684 RepID=UPI003D175843
MLRRICVLGLIATCGLAQAQTQSQPRPQPKAPSQQPQPAQDSAEAMRRAGGSLLRASVAAAQDANQARLADVSFFAVPEQQPRTIRKHDLITIIVREESEYKSEGSTDLKKEASIEAQLEEFIRLKLRNMEVEGGAIGSTPPAIKADAKRDFKGEATVDRSDRFVMRVTAEVIDVKPNGNLVLQARQRIKTDEEEQMFILSGVCRAEDVTPDNTVLSTQMFDKELTKTHKGAVRDTTKRGWLPKLLDAINPF